jgi:hypothetical protein
MKTIIATLSGLLLIIGTRAQDPAVKKTISFYEEKMLPAFQDLLLRQKGKLLELTNPPKDLNINMEKANIYAGLLMFDSSMYYIQQELAHQKIDKDLYHYGFLVLMAKQPEVYKKFTDSVFFGKYNTDTAGRKRYLPSEISMKYIGNNLMASFFYLIEKNGGLSKRREWQLVASPYNQFQKELETTMKGEEVYKGRLPQYSKDGVEITTSIMRGLFATELEAKQLAAARLSEIEPLLAQKDIAMEESLCSFIDQNLLSAKKPQRYGTQITITNDKAALKSPHDSLAEIEKKRKQVGLKPLQEYFREKVENEISLRNMPVPVDAGN